MSFFKRINFGWSFFTIQFWAWESFRIKEDFNAPNIGKATPHLALPVRPSDDPSVPHNFEMHFLHFCHCPIMRDCLAVYLALFLVACTGLYTPLCPFVRSSVGWLVCLLVRHTGATYKIHGCSKPFMVPKMALKGLSSHFLTGIMLQLP